MKIFNTKLSLRGKVILQIGETTVEITRIGREIWVNAPDSVSITKCLVDPDFSDGNNPRTRPDTSNSDGRE